MSNNETLVSALEIFLILAGIMFILGVFVCYVSDARADELDYLSSCSPYEKEVRSILKQEGVDDSFYYLMVAESHCRVGAVSEKGAVGFWQMMPYTMSKFGCEDASNISCQTHAAARYLLSLSERYHNKDDVIAAWNMGGHNYDRIKRRTWEASGLISAYHKIEDKDCQCSKDKSVVVLDENGSCMYWYWVDEEDKLNPCEGVPENAETLWSKSK